jgi:hypothetical protein
MNGLESAVQGRGLAQLRQRQVGFAAQKFAELLLVDLDDFRAVQQKL